jgi:general L-amino acid transport system substrate-binding protein
VFAIEFPPRWVGPILRAMLLAAGLVSTASASPVLDRVKAGGVIRCGAVARPGLLETNRDGAPHGLLVDLCRAIGVAAAGPSVAVRMARYDADDSYDSVRSGRDDVFFLSGSEIIDQKLAGRVLPGPAVFFETSALMVVDRSPVQRPADLAGQAICFLQGDVSHRHLEAFFAARRLSFIRMGFQEEVELYDAFDAQACHAMAGEATTLADVRRQGGDNRRGGRILAEPLASFPILAATDARDGEWSSLVFWTVATLIDVDRPRQDWAAGGLDSLPLDSAGLGLAPEWQKTVLAATGGYADMVRLNLGEASPLKLPAGPNALAGAGGLMTPPFAE